MSFFSKLFGKDKKENKPEDLTPYKPKEKAETPPEEQIPDSKLKWVEASDNQWGVRVLDISPVTQNMTSTSQNPQMAKNAVSYSGEDGVVFWRKAPADKTIIDTHLTLVTDKKFVARYYFHTTGYGT